MQPEEGSSEAESPKDEPTEMPSEQATQGPPTAEPTWSGSLSLEYVPETPTSQAPDPGYTSANGEHWIDVNLSQQMVYAYAGNDVVNSFLVSTGTWLTPTVTGRYHVYVKLRYTDMSGADYYLPNVPYTMYFFRGYGIHGTYWHSNFGTPMSHGCVNLSIPDAEWLYNFSSVGTLVNVHY
jgi:lipoprotein-anchoring transpeptidase ErfK/SrfK